MRQPPRQIEREFSSSRQMYLWRLPSNCFISIVDLMYLCHFAAALQITQLALSCACLNHKGGSRLPRVTVPLRVLCGLCGFRGRVPRCVGLLRSVCPRDKWARSRGALFQIKPTNFQQLAGNSQKEGPSRRCDRMPLLKSILLCFAHL